MGHDAKRNPCSRKGGAVMSNQTDTGLQLACILALSWGTLMTVALVYMLCKYGELRWKLHDTRRELRQVREACRRDQSALISPHFFVDTNK